MKIEQYGNEKPDMWGATFWSQLCSCMERGGYSQDFLIYHA